MNWDPGLLRRFREGDTDALGEVFRRNVDMLTRMLRAAHRGKILDLENTLLEVFARAFEPRARLSYDGIRPYGHFLMGIAKNVLLEQARSRELPSGTSSDLETQIDSLCQPQGAPEQLIEDREVEQLLAAFQETLSGDEAQLYELRFQDGLGQEAAAQKLGLTRIQLRRRELSLKQRLLAFLQGRGYLREMEARGWAFSRRRVGT